VVESGKFYQQAEVYGSGNLRLERIFDHGFETSGHSHAVKGCCKDTTHLITYSALGL